MRVIRLRRNCGQTAALSAALDQGGARSWCRWTETGKTIPPIFRSCWNTSRLATTWSQAAQDRHDDLFTRKIPSWLANRLVARLSGVPLHDFGCTLKAYRRQVLEGVRLYGEMHRFIAIFAAWQGGASKSWSSITGREPPGEPNTGWGARSTSCWT